MLSASTLLLNAAHQSTTSPVHLRGPLNHSNHALNNTLHALQPPSRNVNVGNVENHVYVKMFVAVYVRRELSRLALRMSVRPPTYVNYYVRYSYVRYLRCVRVKVRS